MSVSTEIVFENNTEGTQKRIIINLGWYSPSHFELAGMLKDAATQMDPSYQWDRLSLPIYKSYISRADFDEMVKAHDAISSLPYHSQAKFRRMFTLDKKLVTL